MKKPSFVLLLLLLFCQCVETHDKTNKTQFGFGARMKLNLSGAQNMSLQMSLTGGAARSVFANTTMLFYQPSLILYQGGLGNKATFKDIDKFRFELVNSFGVNLGYQEPLRSEWKFKNIPISRPLTTWSISNAAALQNPYFYSFTLSTNVIWSNKFNSDKTRQTQRVGYMGLSVPYVTLGYSNDGLPFNKRYLPLSDTYDRYWTGRGFLRIEFDYNKDKHKEFDNSVWQLTAEYDKFTGFSRDIYEVANVLGLRFVPYADESAYNKSLLSFSVLNKKQNIGVSATFNNYERLDIQHFIHRKGRYPFHGSVYAPQWGIGLIYDYQNKIPSLLK